MALSKTLFLLLLSLPPLMVLANTLHSNPDVTKFQIDSFDPTSDGLTYERDASVPSGSSYLRLIPTDAAGEPRKLSVGRVLYSNPVKFSSSRGHASFESTIKLRVSSKNKNSAGGMTFFIVPVNSTLPTNGEGGNLGTYNAVVAGSPIFAVQLDTFVDSSDQGPNYSHIGIDINSRVSRSTTSFEDMIGGNVTLRIKYDARTGSITVLATSGAKTAEVSYVYNLKSLLPRQVQVGLSASSGSSNVAFFDVFAWGFTSHPAYPENDVTSFKIDNFNPSSDGLRYERDAYVPSCSKSLRLVGPEKSSSEAGSVGRVLYPSWVDFWDKGRQASFETTITFRVNPIKSDPSYGLTFFIIPYNTTKPTGGEGEGLGIIGAINPNQPFFAVEFNFHDPKAPHIGIHIMEFLEQTTPLEGAVGEIVTARIDYDGTTGVITVYATYGSAKPVTLSYEYYLKSLVREQVQIGLSASTGPNGATFDIFSWSFTSIILTENYDVGPKIKKYVA